MTIQDTIRHQIATNRVVLYMKGTPQFPQCGFSGATVQLLEACGVSDLTHVDVLSDPVMRDGIKVYSSWPTVPQLYFNGEFVGGADIVHEMYQQGELQQLIGSTPV